MGKKKGREMLFWTKVEQAIVMTGAKGMILDPVQAYVGAGMDMNRANEVRSVMAQLGRIAEKHKCAMILVDHLNKSRGAKNQYRGLGSIDFQAAARSVLVVGRIKGQAGGAGDGAREIVPRPGGRAHRFRAERRQRLSMARPLRHLRR